MRAPVSAVVLRTCREVLQLHAQHPVDFDSTHPILYDFSRANGTLFLFFSFLFSFFGRKIDRTFFILRFWPIIDCSFYTGNEDHNTKRLGKKREKSGSLILYKTDMALHWVMPTAKSTAVVLQASFWSQINLGPLDCELRSGPVSGAYRCK